MKKNKIIVAVIFILALYATISAMSDDGGQQPVKPEKKTEAVQLQSEQAQQVVTNEKEGSDKKVKYTQKECPLPVQPERVDSKGIVTDRLGFYTGMTKGELQKFKEDYNKLDKTMFPNTRTTMLYDAKVDLNKYEELKNLGVDLKRSGAPTEAATYKDNTLYSEIVVIGKTIGKEKVTGADTYKIEITEVLKGADILKFKLGEVPKYFNYFDPMTQNPITGKIGLYFWGFAEDIDVNGRRWIQQVTGSTLIYLNDSTVIYERYYEDLIKADDRKKSIDSLVNPTALEKKIIEKYKRINDGIYKRAIVTEGWKEAINNVKRILEVNDIGNFYKNIFKVEAENEK